jgi:hypothetical protein
LVYPGQWVRIGGIVLGTVSRYCERKGLEEGQVVRYVRDEGDTLVLERPDGGVQKIDIPFAWFIRVDPVRN